MHWNEREGNQKEKIKNETRWGQILYSGRKGFSSDALQKEERLCTCIHAYIYLWKKNSFFCMIF